MEPDDFAVFSMTADFYNGSNLVGEISMPVNGEAGAQLFAATTTDQFTSIVLSADPSAGGFAFAAPRYAAAPPLTITDANGMSLQGDTFQITSDPSMPTIQAVASVAGLSQAFLSSTEFTWTAQVSFDPTDASHGGVTTPITYTYTATQTGAPITFDDDTFWHGVIRGGDVALTVSATINGFTLTSNPVDFTIQGAPLDFGLVKQFITTYPTPTGWPTGSYDYHTVLEQIAKQESGGQQFLNGLPIYNGGGDGGVGIAQLTPPYNPATDEQVWDWKANLARGIAIFNAGFMSDVGTSHSSYATRQAASLSQYIAQATKQYGLTKVVIQPFTSNMLIQDAIQLYNGGHDWQLSTALTNGQPLISPTISGTTMTISWDEVGNGYVDKVLGQSV